MSALASMTEKQWSQDLFETKRGVARRLGWTTCYHTLRSKGSQPGFPDWVLARDRTVFVELKREGEKPTERQQHWLTALAKAGSEVYLWMPSDLDEIGLILGGRWVWLPGQHKLVPTTVKTGEVTTGWQPRCLWLPTGARAGAAGS